MACQNLTANRIRLNNNNNNFLNNNTNVNNTNSIIAFDRSDLNRCFIQEFNNEKTISNNFDIKSKISKEQALNNILNVSDIEASIFPNKSFTGNLNNNSSNNNNQKDSKNIYLNNSFDCKNKIQKYSSKNDVKNKNQTEKDSEQQHISYLDINQEYLLTTGKKNINNKGLVEHDFNIMSPAGNKNNSMQDNFNFNNNNISMNNINCAGNANNNNNNNNIIGLPNIENFFIIKDKVFLVDNVKNVWHLKKCKRFDKIQKEFLKENNNSKEVLNTNNNLNNEYQNETTVINIRNQIFNNFLDFYQGLDNQINTNLRENNQSNNLISENDLKSQNNLELNTECKSHRTIVENKILNNSNISKQINFSNYNLIENININNNNLTKLNDHSTKSIKLNNIESKLKNENKIADKILIENNNNQDKSLKEEQIIIENDCNSFANEENQKVLINQSNLIQVEEENRKINFDENYENADNTITSMDLVSDYSRRLNKDYNIDQSQLIRNSENIKDGRFDFQVFETKDKNQDYADQERNLKANKEVDKDTTYNLSEDSS